MWRRSQYQMYQMSDLIPPICQTPLLHLQYKENKERSFKMNHTNEIRKDIAIEFGLEAAGYAPAPKYALTLRQCQILNNRYGVEKGSAIVKRYMQLFGNQKIGK